MNNSLEQERNPDRNPLDEPDDQFDGPQPAPATVAQRGDGAALVSWAKAPSLLELKQDLQDAKPLHDAQVAQIEEWLDNLNVRGRAKPKPAKNKSSIQPKLIRKQAEWRYAALSEAFLSTDDIFKVKPYTWEDRQAAQQNQLVLNHQFNNRIDKQAFIDEYVRAAVDEGTVILRTGWCFEEKEVEVNQPVVQYRANPALAPLHQQLEQMKLNSPSQYDTDVPDEMKAAHDMTMQQGVPIEPVIVAYQPVKKMKTVKNHPTIEVCNFRNVIIDPSCQGDIDKAGFVVYSFEASLSSLQKDGKYKNLDQINLTTNSILGEPDHTPSGDIQNFNFADRARQKFVVYEYWGFRDVDGSGRLTAIVAAWVGDTLIRMEENPFPDKKLPFIIEHYLPVRKAIYGEPDGALLEDNQKVVGAVTRGMIDIMGRSANGQMGMRKDMLDATNRRKWEAGQDYEFNQNVDPRVGVHMHTYPEIPASAQFMLQLQNMEAESMTGVKAYSQGVSGTAFGDVAAAARSALDAASKRELGILRRLGSGIVEAGRKIIAMNAEFLDPVEVVRITNEEFVQVRRDDLAGNFDLRLSISTAEEDHNKAQELAFLLQTMGPNTDPELIKMILSDLCRLRKMPDLAKKIEQYQPQPDPLMQQKAQLEVQLLQAQIAKEQAQTAHFQANAQLHGAKANTEVVKAANIQSDTDQKNLDFVEQESGVKQERELQKQGEQARAQTQLKLVEHGLNQQTMREQHRADLLKEWIKTRNRPTPQR